MISLMKITIPHGRRCSSHYSNMKLQDHLLHDKAPPQFESVSSSEAESAKDTKRSADEADSTITKKRTPLRVQQS
ncbi:hypothetical protein PIB30_040214 [Stylosanthes scabra]|uniref:Uncharacterized protein n=1 Tax=Stylosanthes scabra TaxID=79078 RepID=A0ABU6SEQ8_9FABA|nr:hypothetical protein [Stylosanthes scabra]